MFGERKMTMKKTGIWIVLIAFCGVTGCATMTEQEQTRAQGAGIGAAAGAVGGAMIGAIFGGRQGAAVGAMAGAALGVTAGALYGDHVANQKQKYVTEEDYIHACITSVRQVTNDTMAYNQELGREMAPLTTEVEDALVAYDQYRIQAEELLRTRDKVGAKLGEASHKLENAQSELTIQRQTVERERHIMKTSLEPLEAEIRQLEAAVSELETRIHALESLHRKFNP